jgi:hypothetical protein
MPVTVIPNHHERQLMQQLRGRGWVKGCELPPSATLIGALLRKGWIEVRGVGKELAYQLTNEGMAAKMAPIPPYGIKRRGDGGGKVVQPD